MQNRRLAIIAAIVFVDLLGFSLILPLLPYYADTFGASQIAVSLLAFYGLAFNIFQIIFAQFAQARLELTAQTTSYVLAYVGVLAALVQGVAIRRLTDRFSETTLIMAGVALLTLSLLAWAFVPNLVLLLIVLAPLAAAAGVLNTVISSAITKAVVKEEAGGALGLSAATESLTRVIAPSLGGVLLQWVGTWAPGAFGALAMAGVTAFA